MESQQTANDPWIGAETRYLTGQTITGTVTRITHFGVFVQVEPGLEGIIYTFELGSQPSSIAGYTPGIQLQLYVKSIDASRHRLELSLQGEELPGLLTGHELPPEIRQQKKLHDFSFPPTRPSFESPEKPISVQFCPICQGRNQPFWKHCVYCGESLVKRCPVCSTAQPALPGARYCYECGSGL